MSDSQSPDETQDTIPVFVLEQLDGLEAPTRVDHNPGNVLKIEFANMVRPRSDVNQWCAGNTVIFDEQGSASVRIYLGECLIGHGELTEVDGCLNVRVTETLMTEKQAA